MGLGWGKMWRETRALGFNGFGSGARAIVMEVNEGFGSEGGCVGRIEVEDRIIHCPPRENNSAKVASLAAMIKERLPGAQSLRPQTCWC